MGTNKRERQRVARQARLEAEATAEQRRASRRRMVRFAVVGVLVAAFIAIVSVRGGDDDEIETTDTTALEDPTVDGEPREFTYGSGECPPEGGPDEPVVSFTDLPELCIDPTANDYRATVATSEGTFVIELFDDRAPGTVNNFVTLTGYRYFEGLTFHRVIQDFVIQGGDPNGDGTGGPGYDIVDELPASLAAYTEGAVAMANAGPDSGGSQWFVWFESPPLPGPNFSLFGQVTTDTLAVARAINAVETGPGDAPVTPVTIESITIEVLDDGAIDDDAVWDLGT